MMKKHRIKVAIALWLYCVADWINPELNFSISEKFELPEQEPEKIEPKGRVVKHTAPASYDPDRKRKGGGMVKRMPRQLQKIKEGQEAPLE